MPHWGVRSGGGVWPLGPDQLGEKGVGVILNLILKSNDVCIIIITCLSIQQKFNSNSRAKWLVVGGLAPFN